MQPFPPIIRPLKFYAVVPDTDWVARMADAGADTVQLRSKTLTGEALRREIRRAIAATLVVVPSGRRTARPHCSCSGRRRPTAPSSCSGHRHARALATTATLAGRRRPVLRPTAPCARRPPVRPSPAGSPHPLSEYT